MILLSEHAGAYYDLGEYALTVSPFDIQGTADAMHEALTMKGDERRRRAASARRKVMNADVRAWFYQQVQDALKAMFEDSGKGKKGGSAS